MKKGLFFLAAVLGVSLVGTLQAETDFIEAGAPNGWVFQNFQIYQHGEDFARDDTPLKDLDVDAYITLLRPAYWWDTGVVHMIVPFGYIDEKAEVDGAPWPIMSGNECGMGDMYVGGARRWTGENKDWWFLLGSDVRLPTGDYNSDDDPTCSHFDPFGGFNFGSGSLSVQPFMIFSKLYNQGMFGTDTEVRFDLNTSAGPIQYNPDDRLEVWQTLHMGLSKTFRVGAALKGEFDVKDDDGDNDHSVYLGAGPEFMWVLDKGIVLWGKVLFDTYTNDSAEKLTTFYLRLSFPL